MAALRTWAVLWVGTALLLQAQFVGSKACFGCHSAIYNSFQKTDMGRSMALARDWKAEGVPTTATVGEPGTTHTLSVSRTATGWQQSESDPGVFSIDHALDYVVGSGYNGLTFLIRRGNFLFQAPLSFYSRTQKWDLSPGYEHADLGFGRIVPEECINCHSGRPRPVGTVAGEYAETPFEELPIGCENCHGPGGEHVKGLGKVAGGIVNPAKLTPRLAENICLNCHQAGDGRVTQPGKSYLDFRPGQWLFDTAVIFKEPAHAGGEQDLLEHYSAMRASRCFRESAGKLGCLTCHDPHLQPAKEEAASYYKPKCLICHTEQSCKLALSIRVAQSQPDNCVGCHMPKRDITQISHSALTNHRIPARVDEPAPNLKPKETDGLVVINLPDSKMAPLSKLVLLRAYQQLSMTNPDYRRRYLEVLEELGKSKPQEAYVQAALGDRAFSENHSEEAIEHLKLALSEGNPAIYLELGQSLAKVGRNEEAIEYLKKGVALNPYDATMQKTLILQYISLKEYTEAKSRMQQYVGTFPEDGFMRSLLERVSR